MRHLDLFSGIGGFALATEMAWGDVEHVFCDNEPFAQEVLKKHWPNSKIYGDIRTLTADAERVRLEGFGQKGQVEMELNGKNKIHGKSITNARSEKQRRLPSGEREEIPSAWEGCDLLTGGFPCQPFSQAGRRRGTADDRHLWPEMLRVIRA